MKEYPKLRYKEEKFIRFGRIENLNFYLEKNKGQQLGRNICNTFQMRSNFLNEVGFKFCEYLNPLMGLLNLRLLGSTQETDSTGPEHFQQCL